MFIDLQEPDSMALALGEDGHQHIGAGCHLAPRRLGMDDGALDHPLEAGGRLHIDSAGRADDPGQLVLDIIADTGAKLVDIDLACRQHLDGVTVLGQRQKQVLERREFMIMRRSRAHRPALGFLELA